MSSTSSIGSSQKTIEQIIEEQSKSTASTRNTGELGKDDFLKLLITQVQNQDPMNPSTDTDFIAQMAQFSALEQMQNLNSSFAYTTGFAMMGKYVSGEVTDESGNVKYVEGKVESVRITSGKVYAIVGDYDVPIESITDVSDSSIGSGGNVTEYSSIIGLLAKASFLNTAGKETSIEGIIASVIKEKDGVYTKLDEVEIKPYNLDIGSFESAEEYVNAMAGKEISVRFEDKDTGEKFTIKGILRSAYEDTDGELRFLLDDIKVPVGDINSTSGIDLLSTEQMLLNAILKELQKQNQNQTTPPQDDSGEDTETGTV